MKQGVNRIKYDSKFHYKTNIKINIRKETM